MTVLVVAQILVSLTLATSGLAKVRDPLATQDAMVSLRLPARRAHRAVAHALPWTELALAVLAWVPVPAVQLATGAVTLALFVAYLVVIARALGFAEPVVCSCFGTLGSPTVSRSTLARNALLVAFAAIALGCAGSGLTARLEREAPLAVLASATAVAVTVALTALTLGVSRAGTTTAPEAAPAAAPADEEVGEDGQLDYLRSPIPPALVRRRDGRLQALAAFASGRAVLLVWLSPGCGPCERVFERLPGWRERLAPLVAVHAVLARDVTDLDEATLAKVGDEPVEDLQGTLSASLGAWGTPSAVLLGADGMLAGGPVAGAGDVTEFVDEIVDQLAAARD